MYDKNKAVKYALKWALKRNPKYYNYDNFGGDCTNFISQCLYAGGLQMNYFEKGWYYINGNKKSASWTGVEFLYSYLKIKNYIEEITFEKASIGDIIQFSKNGVKFTHSLIVTKKQNNELYICCHSNDAKNKNIREYDFKKIRIMRIIDKNF
ncbi:MAG: amidase domain-containing protein [Clostridia bacterium]|nr:amidase domain-containing protein [Clostridia bacterium]